ncbi:hypothetical protein DV738_g2678, partial [Chaetothyriales sp. CBS 135597]
MSPAPYDSLVTCIGTGFSGICVGAQLKRWYNETDIVFFERQRSSGGTWWINTYPGIACDVPAPLYSLSFEQSASALVAMFEFTPLEDGIGTQTLIEIKKYLDDVAQKYNLPSKMRFSSDVQSSTWDPDRQVWVLTVLDMETNRTYYHTTKILFASCGQLIRPNELDVPGLETFKGAAMHSARWRKDVDCTGKKVVVIGNGCTAAQIVPNLLKDAKPESVTQLVRSKHYVLPAPQLSYTGFLRWVLTYIPGALWLLRLLVFFGAEMSFPFFYTTPLANWYRRRATRRAKAYMRSKCPVELQDALIPNFELGCKRRIFDPGYLDSLHDPRVHVETRRATQVLPEGIRLSDGTVLEADVIVLANGFRTNYFLDSMKVTGENGKTVTDHWQQFGGAEAYNCSVLSGFPNFFIILGPNAATGHTSAIMASENSVNYALRILKPVIVGERNTVRLDAQAERTYVARMQQSLAKRVWNSGCQSWYIQGDSKWNAMSYPWSQAHYWWRSVFPTWQDWHIQ